MMEQSDEEFFHDFRQEFLADAEANGDFQLTEFIRVVTKELIETGFIEDIELSHYRAQRGMRVDGYWFDDEGGLDLFIADFENRAKLASLTATEVDATFKRLTNFFEASLDKQLYSTLEETSPEYGLARQIADRKDEIRKIRCFLISDRILSDRLQVLEDNEVSGRPCAYQVWDISRLQRQRSSRGQKEPLDINLVDMFGYGLPCLPANLGSGAYRSLLIVIPGDLLADLYEKHGARLLEQNVRSFLQARGQVNKGIRSTILNDPSMFFAYNNGITATARDVETRTSESGLEITKIKDLQIVNGGQTTASLFHTRHRDKASLQDVYVQMKLSVIDSEESEIVVPKISEYANTQNRVNAADFFSNHPFHIRIEEFSRRIWAPAKQGVQRETKWFYERARGQYADAQSNLAPGEKRRFLAEFPKQQMFTKTDLAKFENVWDDKPKWVNLGSQKNFAQFATRIGKEWEDNPDKFSEHFYHRLIARAIIFRRMEKLVSEQSWYNGGYRANVVAYTLSAIGECCKLHRQKLDWERIWNEQEIYQSLETALIVIAKFVNEQITSPPQGISNISEWCKKEACWDKLAGKIGHIAQLLPKSFWSELLSVEEARHVEMAARDVQRIDNGIEAQKQVVSIPADKWSRILRELEVRGLLSKKEADILKIATQYPKKIPSEKQSNVLIELLDRARSEGIV